MEAPRSLLLSLLLCACPSHSINKAKELEQLGQLKEAADRYWAIVKDDPANLGAWDGAVRIWCRLDINVGRCMETLELELDILGNLQRHQDALSEVLELRARARMDQGMANAALSDLVRSEKAAPERASVLIAKARALVMLGRRKDAALYGRRATELEPKNVELDEVTRMLPQEEGFGGAP